MEIGTEISKKIRAAIKGKLQELGAYVDEELPDYIMVMVANKKNAQQMADDLSLFLGNNTIKFTVWLHGVLEKLRSVAVEPASLRPQHLSADPSSGAGRIRVPSADEKREDLRNLGVSSSHSDKTEARVSTSSVYEHHISSGRRESFDSVNPRLTSAVKPLVEFLSSEAVIDIKPEPDDDLIAEELAEGGARGSSRPGTVVTYGSACPSAELYKTPLKGQLNVGQSRTPGRAQESLYGYKSPEGLRSQEQPYSRLQHSYAHVLPDSRGSRTSVDRVAREDEASRKRKAPVASSIVRVNRGIGEGQESDELEEEDDEEDDEGYRARSGGLTSRVSLPSKPERRPSLPPAKQANKNLILKAISEAQESISRTTNYATAPQRQMVPVAPRTRSAGEDMSAAVQLVPDIHDHITRRSQIQSPVESQPARQPVQTGLLSSRLQLDLPEESVRGPEAFVESDLGGMKPSDTRSFIIRRAEAEEVGSIRNRLGEVMEDVPLQAVRTVQTRDNADAVACNSPKFIVTLDGVPSPLADIAESDMDSGDKTTVPASPQDRWPKTTMPQSLQRELMYSDDEEEHAEQAAIPVKRQKVLERCKFWPVCKIGDECMYHHPTAQCKTFPNCKFGDKCLFIHPNCKYDAKCTKADCPFTHVSRRGAPPPSRPTLQSSSSTCRFFPDCKKVDCPFYHPKACRFATQCKRAGCPFYHPVLSVPPRHALKWTKATSS
ncbi:zinc finger CCCH domain-containing protein 14 [Scleropages formosus]|uniref:Zinc finger CCCH domain-containing protein 14 n=1 Tax=Scleropages formosus TaxID=113540 RepID=A0A8C9RHE4_SCLFO|nr:zinc finger CCCH domain-containing protein 14 [Scleropages formosus]